MWKAHHIPGTQVLASLPVLPLPNVVLLPGMVLPLNVHEPRYLELVDFVRTHGMHLGVPLTLPLAPTSASGPNSDLAPGLASGPADGPGLDAPPLEPVFGLGKLVFHTVLNDGRRIIRLEGVGRVRTRHEHPRSRGFREVAVSPLAEPVPTDVESLMLLRANVERITQYSGEDTDGLASLLAIGDERTFLYSLTAFLPSLELMVYDEAEYTADERALVALQQRSLAAESADERARFLLERTGTIVSRLGQQFSAGRLLN